MRGVLWGPALRPCTWRAVDPTSGFGLGRNAAVEFFFRRVIENTLLGEFGILLAPTELKVQGEDGRDGEEKDAREVLSNLQGESCSQMPSKPWCTAAVLRVSSGALSLQPLLPSGRFWLSQARSLLHQDRYKILGQPLSFQPATPPPTSLRGEVREGLKLETWELHVAQGQRVSAAPTPCLVASAPLPASCSSFRPRHVSLPRLAADLQAVILSCNYTLTSFFFFLVSFFFFSFFFLGGGYSLRLPRGQCLFVWSSCNPGLGNDLA